MQTNKKQLGLTEPALQHPFIPRQITTSPKASRLLARSLYGAYYFTEKAVKESVMIPEEWALDRLLTYMYLR
jgi:hypothetical protein